MTPLEVYNHFGIFAWSKKFLRGLGQFSRNVPDRQTEMQLLNESQKSSQRREKKTSNPKSWCVADVETAIESLHDQDNGTPSTSKSNSARRSPKMRRGREVQEIHTPPHTVTAEKTRMRAPSPRGIPSRSSGAANLFVRCHPLKHLSV